jgi:hypothetical protein
MAAPEDRDELRLDRVRRAVEEKMPKLLVEGSRGRRTVLVLEDGDWSLSNDLVVTSAARSAFEAMGASQPDALVLLRLLPDAVFGYFPLLAGEWSIDCRKRWCEHVAGSLVVEQSGLRQG